MLSFTDSDLAAFAAAYERMSEPRPSLRLANLAALKHPYSVDLYLETVCSRARFVVGAAARRHRVLALRRRATRRSRPVPRHRARAAAGRSLRGRAARGGLDAGWSFAAVAGKLFRRGWPRQHGRVPRFHRERKRAGAARSGGVRAVLAAPAFLLPLCGRRWRAAPDEGRAIPAPLTPTLSREERERGRRALIVFYRSIYLADDLAPIDALANAREARGFAMTCVYVTSLKDAAARRRSASDRGEKFDVVLNATAFSARVDEGGGGVLDEADAPVLQVVLAGAGAEAGRLRPAGFARRPRDACRAAGNRRAHSDPRHLLQSGAGARRKPAVLADRPRADGGPRRLCRRSEIGLGELRRTQSWDRRLACVLSDYPAKGGRVGYAVGLDTPRASPDRRGLAGAGYDVGAPIEAEALIAHLSRGRRRPSCRWPTTPLASPRCRRLFDETSSRPGAIPKPTRP